jgi:competence protein ComEA
MDAAPSNPGISASQARPAAPPIPAPRLPTPPSAANVELPTAWPRAAQRVTAGLLVLALGLLGWRALADARWAARPTSLEPDSAVFRVDLNRADRARLMQLPGVGEVLAQRIEEHRRQHGFFRDVDDLRKVSGIGPATLERLRPFVYADPVATNEEDQGAFAEELPADHPQPAPMRPSAARATIPKKTETLSERVDLNRAAAEELQRLPGVGPAMAGRIIAARSEKPFRAVEDLRRVHGIGQKTLERLRPYVKVGAEEQSARRD